MKLYQGTGKIVLSIIIPVYNEEDYIEGTLNSLAEQKDVSYSDYRIVIVNNNSTDGTFGIVRGFADSNPLIRCEIINEKTQSVVAARIAGYNHAIAKHRDNILLSSVDADVLLDNRWVAHVLHAWKLYHYDAISIAGCFPLSFWDKVPALRQAYCSNIGTIFFDRETCEHFNYTGEPALFTENIFRDFIRLATDQCFVITKDAYLAAGGYQREFNDDNSEYFDEGGRLFANLELDNSAKIMYSNAVPYRASPRRFLNVPEQYLQGNAYQNGSLDGNFRSTGKDSYQLLDELAYKFDYVGMQHYIIKNYILLKTITRPSLIVDNPSYFINIRESLIQDIRLWNDQHHEDIQGKAIGKSIMYFAELLTEKYFDVIIDNIRSQQNVCRVSTINIYHRCSAQDT